MKDIRIFIASSKELVQERNELAFLVLAKEEEFTQRGLRVRLAKWEYVDPKMTAGRTEDRYLDEMYKCDAAMVIFKNIAGMYTREELDKALAREAAGNDRLKAHRILFSAEGKPDSDAAKLRASLPEENHGVYANLEELKAAFLALVDGVAKSDRLVDVQDENLHEVSAFVAADDELASDRNAFADTILNLNDILVRRGIRVRMRFYDPERHRELLESSEMALVLYDTNYKAFTPEQMQDAYERTKREENPKRLYVFFRDEDESKLDREFVAFRDGFVENLGHFFCRFENADTLKLNFLLSLENALGDGVSFVKLDGRKIKADELEVAEITRLPMVANNARLSDMMAQADLWGKKFKELSRANQNDPDNNELYGQLQIASAKKDESEARVNKELSQAFDLARRFARLSAKESNAIIARARALLDQGRADEALELLDGASSALDTLLGALDPAEDVLTAVAAEINVQTFRASTVMAYANDSFQHRFAKAESIYKTLLANVDEKLMEYRKGQRRLAALLVDFADLYDRVGDTRRKIPLLDRALSLYRSLYVLEPDCLSAEIAGALRRLAHCHKRCYQLDLAEQEYEEALTIVRDLRSRNGGRFKGELSNLLLGLGDLHEQLYSLESAEVMYCEALEIRREFALKDPAKYESGLASVLQKMAGLHRETNRLVDAEREYNEALQILRRLARRNPAKFESGLACALRSMADFHEAGNKFALAEALWAEAIPICRKLAQENPAKFAGSLAGALGHAGDVEKGMNHLDEAERMYCEALAICRRLAQVNPAKFDSALAASLRNLAILHQDRNRLVDAECEYAEVLAIRRRLAEGKSDVAVAESLEDLAALHEEMGRLVDADCEYGEQLAICRGLAEENPAYDSLVALTQHEIGCFKRKCGMPEDSESSFAEALEIYRRLASENHDEYDASLANTLVEYAQLHRDNNKMEQADSEYAESLTLRRKLAEANPDKFTGPVSETLNGMATLHTMQDKLDVATQEFNEALQIREKLAADHPDKFNERLAETLYEQANLLIKLGDIVGARVNLERAFEMRKALVAISVEKFSEDLEKTNSLLVSLANS